MSRLWNLILFGALVVAASAASGQTLAWDHTKYFKYNIENVVVSPGATTGAWKVRVIFSVSDPTKGTQDQGGEWDIKTAAPFQTTGGSLTLDIAWNPRSEFTNTPATLSSLTSTALGAGAALPVQVRNLHLTGSKACADMECPGVTNVLSRKLYWVEKEVTPAPGTNAGRVALEGRPVCKDLPNCPAPSGTTYANIPVTSATADFSIPATNTTTALIANPRRKVVAIEKCQGCHANKKVGDVFVPRLSLHGANRNENLDLCVACHNPNQTDVPYRYADAVDPRIGAAETPIDFKVMVHSIHAGGFRTTPYVVVGFKSSVNDFSGVRFPKELRKSCPLCHVADSSGRWSFELPLNTAVLGTTIKTLSVYQVAAGAPRSIDVNPANDTKISPTAATCSGCHDKSEVRSHMIRTGGASFATTQAQIGVTVNERCDSCHGRGKDKDVRKVHELFGFSD
jgi:OmcA/MtrC family decaheme c-type cytochrome